MVEKAYSRVGCSAAYRWPDEIDAADRGDVSSRRRNEEIFNAGFQKAPGMRLHPRARSGSAGCVRETDMAPDTDVDRLLTVERATGFDHERVPIAPGIVRETGRAPLPAHPQRLLQLRRRCDDGDAPSDVAGCAEKPASRMSICRLAESAADDDDYTPERERWAEPAPLIPGYPIAFELQPTSGEFTPRFRSISILR